MATLSMPTQDSTPVEIHYEDQGAGAPVVLIHGWPLSGASWSEQVPALLEAGHRVVTYDRRGFGASSQPASGYDYDTFAADLDALMTHLDLQGATLVGFSMGGGEVARYLSTHGSARVAKAVFAAAVPPYLYQSDDNPDGALDDATIEGFEKGVREDRLGFLEEFSKGFFSADGELKVTEQQRADAVALAAPASPEATLACIAAFGRTDFRGDLEKVDVPTLVVHGDGDGVVPFEASGARTARSVPGAQLHVVAGGPHGINVSHAEEFNRVLLAFLAG